MFFSRFKNIEYDGYGMKDLSTALVIRPEIKENKDLFFWYELEDWETPDSCAFDHYGNSKYNFVIMLMNDIVDPFFDWPLSYNDMKRMCAEEYGEPTITNGKYNENGYNAIRFLEKNGIMYPIVRPYSDGMQTTKGDFVFGDGSGSFTEGLTYFVYSTVGNANGQTMDSDTNNDWRLADTEIPFDAIPITHLEYEERQNDAKRRIKILYPELISQLDKELDYIFNNG